MKKTSIYTLAIICGLCLFSTTSKECGKIIPDKISAETTVEKSNAAQKPLIKEEKTEAEFSLIHTLFFQTT